MALQEAPENTICEHPPDQDLQMPHIVELLRAVQTEDPVDLAQTPNGPITVDTKQNPVLERFGVGSLGALSPAFIAEMELDLIGMPTKQQVLFYRELANITSAAERLVAGSIPQPTSIPGLSVAETGDTDTRRKLVLDLHHLATKLGTIGQALTTLPGGLAELVISQSTFTSKVSARDHDTIYAAPPIDDEAMFFSPFSFGHYSQAQLGKDTFDAQEYAQIQANIRNGLVSHMQKQLQLLLDQLQDGERKPSLSDNTDSGPFRELVGEYMKQGYAPNYAKIKARGQMQGQEASFAKTGNLVDSSAIIQIAQLLGQEPEQIAELLQNYQTVGLPTRSNRYQRYAREGMIESITALLSSELIQYVGLPALLVAAPRIAASLIALDRLAYGTPLPIGTASWTVMALTAGIIIIDNIRDGHNPFRNIAYSAFAGFDLGYLLLMMTRPLRASGVDLDPRQLINLIKNTGMPVFELLNLLNKAKNFIFE